MARDEKLWGKIQHQLPDEGQGTFYPGHFLDPFILAKKSPKSIEFLTSNQKIFLENCAKVQILLGQFVQFHN